MRLVEGDYHYTTVSWAFQRVTKTLYMTLGPKFLSCNRRTIARRTRHLRKRKALILKALVETHLSSYSKRDLRQFPIFWPRFRSLSKSNSFTFLVVSCRSCRVASRRSHLLAVCWQCYHFVLKSSSRRVGLICWQLIQCFIVTFNSMFYYIVFNDGLQWFLEFY